MSGFTFVSSLNWQFLWRMVRATRQHHALEHATLQILAGQTGDLAVLGGFSDPGGFVLFGDLAPSQVETAAARAVEALQEGQAQLAIHPRCGTNLLTQAVLSLCLAWTVWGAGRRVSLVAVVLALLGFMAINLFGQALGERLQAYTTLADVRDRQVGEIYGIEVLGRRGVRVCVADTP